MPRRRREPPNGKCRLDGDLITITTKHERVKKNGEVEEYEKVVIYRFEALEPSKEIGWPAIRLQPIPEAYDIIRMGSGYSCTCADFVYSREYSGTPSCKHILSLKNLGLLSRLPPLPKQREILE